MKIELILFLVFSCLNQAVLSTAFLFHCQVLWICASIYQIWKTTVIPFFEPEGVKLKGVPFALPYSLVLTALEIIIYCCSEDAQLNQQFSERCTWQCQLRGKKILQDFLQVSVSCCGLEPFFGRFFHVAMCSLHAHRIKNTQ